jgi:hypothetical protein
MFSQEGTSCARAVDITESEIASAATTLTISDRYTNKCLRSRDIRSSFDNTPLPPTKTRRGAPRPHLFTYALCNKPF